MERLLLITAAISIVFAPVFPYEAGDISHIAGPRFPSVLNSQPTVLLQRPFQSEMSNRGRIVHAKKLDFPLEAPVDQNEQKTPAEPPKDLPAEQVVSPFSTEQAPVSPDMFSEQPTDTYISAGPDGCGVTHTDIFLGSTFPSSKKQAFFSWEQIGGNTAEISDPFSYNTYFTATEPGIYRFLLKADFPAGDTMFDKALFTIDAPGENCVPCAYAGKDVYTELDTNEVITLNGSGFDADGDRLSFEWAQVDGPQAPLYFAATDSPEFTPSEEGIYTFSLTVSDGELHSLPDEISVYCYPAHNHPPVAECSDITLALENPPQYIMLDGSLSTDPDNDSLNFLWEQTGGPEADISDHSVPCPVVCLTQPGYYWFRLTVDDNVSTSIPKEVSITATGPDSLDEENTGYGCSPSTDHSPVRSLFMIILAMFTILILSRRKQ